MLDSRRVHACALLLIWGVCPWLATTAVAQDERDSRDSAPILVTPGLAEDPQRIWQSLSPEEQASKIEAFVQTVGPAVRRALRERAAQAPPVRRQQVVGKGAQGVFTLPSVPSDETTPVAPSFVQSAIAAPLPCGLSCGDNQPPQVSISASPTSGNAPLVVDFAAQAFDPDGVIIDTAWSFGDGAFSLQRNPTHTYTAPGVYNVDIEVTDNQGESAWATLTITVNGGGGGNQAPQVSISAAPSSGTAPLTVSFTASASDPDGWITAYTWSFGDGTTTAGGASASHTYNTVGTYWASIEVTDNQGATASAGVTIQAASTAADADNDGLADGLEDALAQGFMPRYHVSAGEQAGTGFARFQDTTTVAIQQNLPALPPAVHWRVSPLFVSSVDGVPHQFVQADYLTLWNRDDGLDLGGLCHFNATILGGLTGYSLVAILDQFGSHFFDGERSAVLLAAPLSSAGDPSAYRAYHFYSAAHEGTLFDQSAFFAPGTPLPPGNHLELWLARSKHATYAGNPDHRPLIPWWIILATYDTIDWLYENFQISFWDYLIYQAIANEVFYVCAVEDFTEQGSFSPGLTLNVGEPEQPLNGSSWIADPRVATKLQPLWVVVP